LYSPSTTQLRCAVPLPVPGEELKESGVGRPSGEVALGGGDEGAVVVVPGMEAGHEEGEPGAENLAHHAGTDPGEPQHPRPGACAGDSVLAEQLERADGAVDDEITGNEQHHLGLNLPALEARQRPGGEEPGVVGDSLVLDLLDRVPAPQSGVLRI